VVFVKKPSDWEEILETIRRLETGGMNIVVCRDGKYIAVNRPAFIKSRGFKDLLSKSEQLARM
jgi:hypothetical protein